MKAMIFAAGLGTRLRPVTDTIPKALIEVGGRPMLARVIDRIAGAGINEIVVNVHHHAEKVKEWLAANTPEGVTIDVSDESELLLDTGGGVAKAIPLLGTDDDVLLHNADIFTDFDLREMIAAHTEAGADATLLADKRKTSRYLLFGPDGRMTGWTNISTGEIRSPFGTGITSSSRPLAFGGVHIISPRILCSLAAYAERGQKFSITPFYISGCAEFDIRAFTPAAPYRWIDIGKPETLAKAIEIACQNANQC